MRVALFTAGTVGAGHLMRGVAIARAIARAGLACEFRHFGPRLAFPPEHTLARYADTYEIIDVLADRMLRDRVLAAESPLTHALESYRPDVLIVDVFWLPLRWVLPFLRVESWLLVRTAPSHWLTNLGPISFVPSQYARIIGMEPVPYREVNCVIDPIVVANPEECQPPEALRAHFGVPAEERLAVVAHAGERGELEQLRAAAPEEALRELDLHAARTLFPAAEWLGGADRIVCGGGFNSFWEAKWLGYADRTTFVPFPRNIDDQAHRITTMRDYEMYGNGADQLVQMLQEG